MRCCSIACGGCAPSDAAGRLAIAAAHELVAGYADRAHFVSLAPIGDASLVVASVAQALEVRESGRETRYGSRARRWRACARC